MKTYDPAPEHVTDKVKTLLMRYHPRLAEVQLHVDCIFCATDEEGEHAVMLHGWPCLAVVRIVSLKERAMGRGDAEIVIDSDKYNAMTEPQRDALLDHELYHLELKTDRNGQVAFDSRMRQKLKMRHHDHEFGWFDEIARRHGEASTEVQQANNFRATTGQLYFKFAAVKVA